MNIITFHCFLFACASCTLTIKQPDNLIDPVPVILVDHGNHPSLLLPESGDRYIRFAYGEWEWYAKSNNGFWRVFPAGLWPTDSGIAMARLSLGSRQFKNMDIGLGLAAKIREGYEKILILHVERRLAGALKEKLLTHFYNPAQGVAGSDMSRDDGMENMAYGLYFVPYPNSYTLLSNCNAVMVDWLEELGLSVSGVPLFSIWQLDAAE